MTFFIFRRINSSELRSQNDEKCDIWNKNSSRAEKLAFASSCANKKFFKYFWPHSEDNQIKHKVNSDSGHI